MGELHWDWIGIGALLLGGAAVLWGVTNGKIKLQLNQPSMEERLARYPASAGATLIKAQRARALKRMLPAILLGLPAVLAVHFVPTHTAVGWLCDQIGAEQTVHWLLRMLFPGLPAVLAVAAALAMRWAVRVLRGGYAPPLDTVVFHDTIAVTGWRAKLHGWLVLTVIPLMVAVLFHVTHGFVQTFDTEANRQMLSTIKCSKITSK